MIAPSQHDETEVNRSQKKLIIINSQITRISSSINQHNAILSISMELISLLQAVVKGKGAKVKQCTHHEGCTNQVVKGGVCIMHGAKQKRSSHEGCTKQARSGVVTVDAPSKPQQDLCHTWRKKETIHLCWVLKVRCTNIGVKRGVCITHGAKVDIKRCSFKKCTSYAQKGGACKRHGAKGRWRR